MKSTKCVECGFVGWSDVEYCKACGAPLHQPRSHSLPSVSTDYAPETEKKGMAIAALVLGIVSFLTLGFLGIGAIVGIILAAIAMSRAKREPWKFGGRGMAIAGLVLCIVSLVALPFIGIVAAIAIPNLLASRRAANEGSAISSMRKISSAEQMYHAKFDKYGTLNELHEELLIDPQLATGIKNGYSFTVKLSDSSEEGFAVFGVPTIYRNTGMRSFYVDETMIVRGSDNFGGPSSALDQPLGEPGSEFKDPRNDPRKRPVDYRGQPVY